MHPPATAFPPLATPSTPGQAQSRLGLAALQSKIDGTPWECDFYHLLEQGFEWRVAVFIAWASSPVVGRVPKTQGQLATEFLNLTSDRAIRKWRAMNPKIDQFVAKMKAEPLLRYRDAAFRTLGELAIREDPDTHQDRQLFFEMTGDYRPKSAMTLMGPNNGPVEFIDLGIFARMNEAELERFAANLETAIRSGVAGAPAPAGG
jgi:hypothetical protein